MQHFKFVNWTIGETRIRFLMSRTGYLTFCAISFQLESSFQFVLFIYLPPIYPAKPRAKPTIIFFQERSTLTPSKWFYGIQKLALITSSWRSLLEVVQGCLFQIVFFYHSLFSKSKKPSIWALLTHYSLSIE